MIRITALTLALGLAATPLVAQEAPANPQIDYDGFVRITLELAETRDKHRLNLDQFQAKMADGNAILLDTRSAQAFWQGHIKGAVNLPFSDFTSAKLAEVLGDDPERPILIYCNNNFSDNIAPVVAKKAELALNIPTFINLHGYGYTNIWELADVVSTSDVEWVTPLDAEQPSQP